MSKANVCRFHERRNPFHAEFTVRPHTRPVQLAEPPLPDLTMHSNDKQNDIVRIDLTDSQKVQVKMATGKDAESIELNTQELEERIAPRVVAP